MAPRRPRDGLDALLETTSPRGLDAVLSNASRAASTRLLGGLRAVLERQSRPALFETASRRCICGSGRIVHRSGLCVRLLSCHPSHCTNLYHAGGPPPPRRRSMIPVSRHRLLVQRARREPPPKARKRDLVKPRARSLVYGPARKPRDAPSEARARGPVEGSPEDPRMSGRQRGPWRGRPTGRWQSQCEEPRKKLRGASKDGRVRVYLGTVLLCAVQRP
ncbi:hypothetical protein M885DRAFT_2501 [Pelagophyceae sp. CCMP2097]|nr:hypothetical protein M885DRAFT_2501 [Pelagophyceae sp. CCMP2097]|mmetsp:Transcript_32369/g.113938  ORF Transcript_32369/g.113938 Transcript_32369/m.113938 type:complete len:219 (-) Transcript_32369:575-1231(-)